MGIEVLDGRVALVTGGTRGIGRGIVEAFLAAGATVVMMGRDATTGAKVVAELGTARVSFHPGDVTSRADVEGAIDSTVERHGRVEILVNNAGGMPSVAPLVEVTDEEWAETLAWNLTWFFHAMRHAAPIMSEHGWGRIINIGSFRGKQPAASQAPYSAAKAGVNALTRAMALELAGTGVTANVIAPGLVLTDFTREAGGKLATRMGVEPAELYARIEQSLPSRRFADPSSLGAMAVHLASDAGGCITGAVYTVDGGASDY